MSETAGHAEEDGLQMGCSEADDGHARAGFMKKNGEGKEKTDGCYWKERKRTRQHEGRSKLHQPGKWSKGEEDR
ncbi:Hypothetical protein FKW44_025263 [Caligus rogercresseyi]|uniref:Uncharacterized protein n=1 Tax=Caligus rogercresseyi TaxID=217165 RepID=A0A7T8GL16_CALRO|nr:Hypothetical protein FKW44_025263 [Caligus rogercresseyi]